jgi:hypothetical protein
MGSRRRWTGTRRRMWRERKRGDPRRNRWTNGWKKQVRRRASRVEQREVDTQQQVDETGQTYGAEYIGTSFSKS